MERITKREMLLVKNALAFAAGTLVKEMSPDTPVDELFFDFITCFAENEFSNFCECHDIHEVVVEDY